ncbi:MAG: 4-hydroxy-3-methylbut-2-enyl diphosphate reductase [Candidatus Omnitrophica bacterium]|nr:4-hydroxy-3-methylbut-2-enyl diphosphate reductase [Candidatus Omnitrophota bacterium]
MSVPKSDNIIRTSFGLKKLIQEDLERDYKSPLVEKMKAEGNQLRLGDLEFRLAEEFGFCYGVDKAVDFAYETRKQFPGKRIFITNEIIHNPRVNLRLRELGIEFLNGTYSSGKTMNNVTAEDVVIIPAFGATVSDLNLLKTKKCVLVETTCGSVVHVWKRVEKYAKDGFTSIIHGKFKHEETMATSSQVTQLAGGKFIVVRDKEQAQRVCRYIEKGGDRAVFLEEFRGAVSVGFDPDRDLDRVGCANQTTMLSSESLEIAELVKQALTRKFGPLAIDEHFRSFDTICSATQDRQDAVLKLAQSNVDLILVIGGYNSSNTTHLAEISSQFKPAYHIEDARDILSIWEIRHQPVGRHDQVTTRDWLPVGVARIGLTAGASTPNRVMEDIVNRINDLRQRLAAAGSGCCDL